MLIYRWFSNWGPETHGGLQAGAWRSVKKKKNIYIFSFIYIRGALINWATNLLGGQFIGLDFLNFG